VTVKLLNIFFYNIVCAKAVYYDQWVTIDV